MKDVALIAVQAALHPERYRSETAYRAFVMDLTMRAVAELPPAEQVPRLVAWPELAAVPLPWLLHQPPDPRDVSGLAHLLGRRLSRPGTWLREAWRARRFGVGSLHLPGAAEAGRIHAEAFAAAARAAEATVVAGGWIGPEASFEPSLGWHLSDARVRNRCDVYGPTGTLLASVDKVHLTPGIERRIGIVPGRVQDLAPIHTPVGPLGVAVCLDAFHDAVVGRLDGAGARILVQPSGNDASWQRPWPPDPSVTEGEAWWRHGMPRVLQDRLHLVAGVNPMAVGEVLGLAPRGRSSIWIAGATGRAGIPAGMTAVADSASEETIVRTVASLPRGYAGRPT